MTSNVLILAGRLNTGWIVCEREVDPAKRARLEDHWLDLLRRYEDACDQCPARPALIDTTRRAA